MSIDTYFSMQKKKIVKIIPKMLEATIQNLVVRDLCSPVLISSELKEKIILITTDGAIALIATSKGLVQCL